MHTDEFVSIYAKTTSVGIELDHVDYSAYDDYEMEYVRKYAHGNGVGG